MLLRRDARHQPAVQRAELGVAVVLPEERVVNRLLDVHVLEVLGDEKGEVAVQAQRETLRVGAACFAQCRGFGLQRCDRFGVLDVLVGDAAAAGRLARLDRAVDELVLMAQVTQAELEQLVELAERLVATMPPETGLDAVMLVNSGSEANDLAWRLATTATGHRGAIVTGFAYHGVTTAIADFSPEEWPQGFKPEHVETITPFGEGMGEAVAALDARGHGLAATYLDCGFTSDGIWTPPAEDVQAVARATREAGGLVVADEVQAGHGRSGEHLWSFAQYGLAPDVVTLGKPMGNGYPVAAVIARQALFDRLKEETEVFSTFGGR